MDFLTDIEDHQRATIANFARETLGEEGFERMLEQVAEILSSGIALPRLEPVAADWMKSKQVFATDLDAYKLIGGAAFANAQALRAREAGNHSAAVKFMLMAERFLGQAERAYRGPKISAREAGGANGKRFAPLRQYAFDRANQYALAQANLGKQTKARQAALAIVDAVSEEARRLNTPLTADKNGAFKRVYAWLCDMGYEPPSLTPQSGSRGT